MPSKYSRKPGSRRYVDYSEADLAECLAAIRSKVLTQRAAADLYKIPRSTIKNKLAERFPNKPGRPTVFTEEEEAAFVAHITALSEYGFPLTDFDLKMIIKDYLESQGRNVANFKNNTPGKDWLKSFITRQRSLTRRFANNIKRVRAAVSEAVISEFIENIKQELENVPPDNVYNYDETNLCDDPGKKRVLCRRGTKYPETVVNATKISFTVMFCGNAAGEHVPPFIIYKSEHLWSTWTENGPEGARYNRTKSGWIDAVTFEDWFLNHLMPILKKKEGRKVVIGDNLSSHINTKVLSECENHNVSFVCLPPNATHILQPLDVAVFRPLKVKWRQTLLNWKDTQMGRNLPTTPKDQFPRLLKKALDSLTEPGQNLISGFKKAGIFPINKEEPLARLPKQDRVLNVDLVGNCFMQKLTQSRIEICPEKGTTRKRKLNVPPGKSICAKDLGEAGPSGLAKVKSKKMTVARKLSKRKDYSSTSCSDSDITVASSTEDHIVSFDDFEDEVRMVLSDSPVLQIDSLVQNEHEPNLEVTRENSKQEEILQNSQDSSAPLRFSSSKTCSELNLDVGDYVLVTWNSRKYPGQVVSICQEGVLVSCLKRGKLFWRWPVIKDEQLYSWSHIICIIEVPVFVKKGCFSIPEMEKAQ